MRSALSDGFEFTFARTVKRKLPSKVVLLSACMLSIIPVPESVPEIRVMEV